MPPKRRAAAKAGGEAKQAVDTTPRRSGRSASTATSAAANAGSKRKASPSPSPATAKAVKKGRTQSPSPAPTGRQASRGRAAAKKEEPKVAEPPKGRGSSRVTRNVVQEAEEKQPKGRSSSKQSKAAATPKQTATPKAKEVTPKKVATPKKQAASPKQRSATPKKSETKKETPKSNKKSTKEVATPKQKAKPSPKQKATPKRKTSPTPKSSPKPRGKASPAPAPQAKSSSRSRSRRGRQEDPEPTAPEQEEKKTVEEPVKDSEDPVVDQKSKEVAVDASKKAGDQAASSEEEVEQPVEESPKEERTPSEGDESGEKEDENVEQDQTEEDDQTAESDRVEGDVLENQPETETGEQAGTAPAAEGEAEAMETETTEDQEPEEPAESEQAESDEKECESAESEQVVDAVTNAGPVEQVPAVENDATEGDGGEDEAEVISDSSDKPQADQVDDVVALDEDSGEAIVTGEEPAVVHDVDAVADGGGDTAGGEKTAIGDIQEISDDDIEEIGINGDSAGVEMSSENGDTTGVKRKLEEENVITNNDVEVKKARKEEQTVENGGQSIEEVVKEYVVIEMGDVPDASSDVVKECLPSVDSNAVSNDSEQSVNVDPVFNRTFLPNPAFTNAADSSKQFSIVSYNMLADCHLLRNDYSFTEDQYLKPEFRLARIIEELKYLDGDVVCMQEVDPDYFNGQLLPTLQGLGYAGFHKKRTQDFYKEGEATFYKTSKFSVVEHSLNRLADLVDKQMMEGLDPTLRSAVQRYMDLADVVVITKLRCNTSGQEVTVGNVHINWGEMKMPDAQCVQIASAVREIVSKAGSDNYPHIICGDFNSPPNSAGYLVARDGYPSGDDTINSLMAIEGLELAEGKRSSLVNAVWPAFQHTSSSLKSAYLEVQGREPDVTSYNRVMLECVDYIFYSCSSLDNVGVLQTPSRARIMETGGTPNRYFPSDHVSIKAVLAFK